MIDLLQRALSKLDDIEKRLASLDTIATKQEQNLAEHMRRTELLETRVEKSDSKLNKIIGLLLLGAGASSVYYWPVVKDLLRIIL